MGERRVKQAAAENGKDHNNNHNNNNNQQSKEVVAEDDPQGKKLLEKDFLEECKKYAAVIGSFAPNRQTTWILQYDVAVRRKKTLMALRALFRAREIDPL